MSEKNQGKDLFGKIGLLVLAVLAGADLVFISESGCGVDRSAYNSAVEPLVKARNFKIDGSISPLDITHMLNPCITAPPLPLGCEKYAVNGVMTQPPIKIIIDPAVK